MRINSFPGGASRCGPLLTACLWLVMAFASTAYAEVSHLYVASTGNDTTGNGSSDRPYKSILKASQAATPGAIIHVAPGTYTGGFMTTASGRAGERISYVSDINPVTKARARLVPPSSTVTTGSIWENRGAHVDIEGFEFDGTGTKMPNGLINQGSYVTIKNNHVHHVIYGDNQLCDGAGGSGINIHDYDIPGLMTGTVVTGNRVHDIGYDCSKIQNIYISTRATVTNNLSYNNPGGAGIHLWHDAHLVIIANNTVANTWMGIIVGGGNYYETTGPADYVDVSNNIVYNNDYGISLQGRTGTNNTYTNNLVYQNSVYNFSPGLVHSGTVARAPLFVNQAGGDFHLAPNSPAINAGSPTFAPSVDLDGNARPSDGAYDIGAYEYGASSSGQTLTFWEKDSEAGTTAGYWYKQALVDGVVVWERDVTADGTAWQAHSVVINPASSSFELKFRLISKAGVSNYPISFNVDDVAINGVAIVNPGFESTTGWTYTEDKAAFTGVYDTAFHGGARSYKLSYPGSTPSVAGDSSTVSQQVSANKTLTFWERDSEAGTTAGYWFKQALVDGVVVWESDVTADGTAWQAHTISIAPAGPSSTLQFRLISKAGVTNYPISVNIDDVAVNGVAVTNGGFETATGWSYAENKASFTGSYDTAAFHGGAASYRLFYPGATTSAAGDNSTVSQTLAN
ncbi:choice-of-anchor Q domain-containing protein [Pyxidicoccus sp. 3LFB2]